MHQSTTRTLIRSLACVTALSAACGIALSAQGKTVKSPMVAKSPAAPLQRYAVDMWWNIGGDGSGLQTAVTACNETLGDRNSVTQMNFPSTTVVTAPMLDCLKGKGWHPAGAPRPS